MHKIDIVVTQHAPLLRYLRELGLADETTTHIEHASISDIAGKHVAGVLPVAMAALCASYTEVPMSMTPADRAALRQGDLSYERMREIASDPKTYYITSDRPWPVLSTESPERQDIETRQDYLDRLGTGQGARQALLARVLFGLTTDQAKVLVEAALAEHARFA